MTRNAYRRTRVLGHRVCAPAAIVVLGGADGGPPLAPGCQADRVWIVYGSLCGSYMDPDMDPDMDPIWISIWILHGSYVDPMWIPI